MKMARFCVLFCVLMCLQIGLCQFSFFPQREERHRGPFTLLPNTIRETISGFLHPGRTPGRRPVANDVDPNQPFYQGNQQPFFQGNQQPNHNDIGQRPVAFPTYFPEGAPNSQGATGHNQDQFYVQGNQGQFNEQGNQGQFNDQGNQGQFNDQGNQGQFNDQGNQEQFNGQGNQEDYSGQDSQGPPLSQNDQGIRQPIENSNVNFDNNDNKGVSNPQEEIPNDPVNFEDNTTPKLETPAPTVQTTEASKAVNFPDTESRNNFDFQTTPPAFSQTCTTVDGDLGSCINLYSCQPFIKILKDSRSNPAVARMLRQAHCGFEGSNPKVCCPLQGLPNTPAPVTTTTSTTTQAPTTPTTPTTPNTPTTPAPVPTASPKTNTDSGDYVTLPEPPVCGTSNASLGRVVGGENAKLGAFPWMALLGYKRGDDTRWLCGGSLVSSRHVLTAAHCVHNHEADLYLVRLGELDLAREDEGATPLDVLIKEKIKHEEYNAKAFTSDIAILVLQKEVQFSELIKPICIPRAAALRSMTFVKYNPIIAGWGDTEFRGPSATHLQMLQLPVVTNEFCANAYSQYKAQKIDERVLCAGFVKGGKDACQGDSGGPLMQPIYNTVDLSAPMYQIGVVSYGKKCAEAGFPGVYSRVTHFVPWIEEKIIGPSSR